MQINNWKLRIIRLNWHFQFKIIITVNQQEIKCSTMPRTAIDLTRFNKIATQGAPQMAVDKEAYNLSRVYSYYSKFNLRLFYV